MRFLRQNTAVIVTVGPFYDKTDGVTIETALTITNERITLAADTDDGSAPTNILDNVTGATTGTSNDLNYITGNDAGMMQLELSAANTNRVGRVLLSITDAANHVPVFHEFFVIPQAIYDWFTGVIVPLPANVTTIAGSAVSTTSAQLGVNVVNAAGTAWGSGAITAASVATGAITNAKFAAGAIDAAAIANGAIDAATFAADVDAEILSYIVDDATRIDASAINTASGTSIPAILVDTGTTLDTLIKDIPTVAEFEARTLAAADYVVVTDTIARVTLVDTTTINTDMVAAAPSAAAVADAVWDEAIAGHADAGSTGAALSAASSAGDPWGTAIPGAYGAGTAGNILGNRLVGTIATGTHNPQTGDAYARLGAPAGASVSADVAAVKSDTAAILTDTGTTLDTLIKDIPTVAEFEARTLVAADYTVVSDLGTVQTGDCFARLGAPAGASVSADVAAIKAQTAAIEADTQDLQTQVGTDGAGLTAVPWNAAWDAEVQSECADALTAYDPPTKAELDSAVANVSVDEIQASALADLFNTDSGTTYAAAVSGSVVSEIADNAGGSSLTVGGIADAVWDEALAGHADAGSAGAALSAAGTAGDPWITELPGAYGAGSAGNILGNRLVGTIASGTHNAQSGDAYARLGAPAGASVSADVAAAKSDTAAILLDTGTDGVVVAAASKTGYTLTVTTGLGNQTANITGNLSGSVGSVTGAVGSVTGAVGSVTGAVGSVTGNVGGSVASVAANGITATSIATDAINAAAIKADAVTKVQSGLATPTNITAGTITTVTNLTNAPTAGDLTATMKASVTAAATAATPTAAAVTGAVGSVTGNVGGNVVGSVASVTAGVTLANDAITAAKFDESTAFPLTSVDTGATRVARTGADSDTLETISDQLDQAVLDGVLFLGDTQIA